MTAWPFRGLPDQLLTQRKHGGAGSRAAKGGIMNPWSAQSSKWSSRWEMVPLAQHQRLFSTIP